MENQINQLRKSNILLAIINVSHLLIFIPKIIWRNIDQDNFQDYKSIILFSLSLILCLYVFSSWKLAKNKIFKFWLLPLSILLLCYYVFMAIPSNGISLVEGSAFGIIFILVSNPFQAHINLSNSQIGYLTFIKWLLIGSLTIAVIATLTYFWGFFTKASPLQFMINLLVGVSVSFSFLLNIGLLLYIIGIRLYQLSKSN